MPRRGTKRTCTGSAKTVFIDEGPVVRPGYCHPNSVKLITYWTLIRPMQSKNVILHSIKSPNNMFVSDPEDFPDRPNVFVNRMTRSYKERMPKWNPLDASYRVHHSFLEVGAVVAVNALGKWFRGMIVPDKDDHLPEGAYQVWLVDFGEIIDAQHCQITFLHKEFEKYPMWMQPCRVKLPKEFDGYLTDDHWPYHVWKGFRKAFNFKQICVKFLRRIEMPVLFGHPELSYSWEIDIEGYMTEGSDQVFNALGKKSLQLEIIEKYLFKKKDAEGKGIRNEKLG